MGISHSISDYLRYGLDCAAWGEREREGEGIIFGLTRQLPMQGFEGTMLMLIPTHFYGMSPDSIPIFRRHNIDDQLFSQQK